MNRNIYKPCFTTTTTMIKQNIKCSKCGYEWKTRTKMLFVVCPKCLRKAEVKNEIKDEVEKEIEDEVKNEDEVEVKRLLKGGNNLKSSDENGKI